MLVIVCALNFWVLDEDNTVLGITLSRRGVGWIMFYIIIAAGFLRMGNCLRVVVPQWWRLPKEVSQAVTEARPALKAQATARLTRIARRRTRRQELKRGASLRSVLLARRTQPPVAAMTLDPVAEVDEGGAGDDVDAAPEDKQGRAKPARRTRSLPPASDPKSQRKRSRAASDFASQPRYRGRRRSIDSTGAGGLLLATGGDGSRRKLSSSSAPVRSSGVRKLPHASSVPAMMPRAMKRAASHAVMVARVPGPSSVAAATPPAVAAAPTGGDTAFSADALEKFRRFKQQKAQKAATAAAGASEATVVGEAGDGAAAPPTKYRRRRRASVQFYANRRGSVSTKRLHDLVKAESKRRGLADGVDASGAPASSAIRRRRGKKKSHAKPHAHEPHTGSGKRRRKKSNRKRSRHRKRSRRKSHRTNVNKVLSAVEEEEAAEAGRLERPNSTTGVVRAAAKWRQHTLVHRNRRGTQDSVRSLDRTLVSAEDASVAPPPHDELHLPRGGDRRATNYAHADGADAMSFLAAERSSSTQNRLAAKRRQLGGVAIDYGDIDAPVKLRKRGSVLQRERAEAEKQRLAKERMLGHTKVSYPEDSPFAKIEKAKQQRDRLRQQRREASGRKAKPR